MSRIDFRQRLLEHPAWLMMLKVMHPLQKTRRTTADAFYECLNLTLPKEESKLTILRDLTSACVVCGRVMHPLVIHDHDFGFQFTCGKPSCDNNAGVLAAMDEMKDTALLITTPDQKVLF